MAYFADLTEHTYTGFRNALSVGWLEIGHDYRTGRAPKPFFERLDRYYRVNDLFGTFGYHECTLCPPILHKRLTEEEATEYYKALEDPDFLEKEQLRYQKKIDEDPRYDHGEIFVLHPTDGLYIAPRMLKHYMNDHGYLPPDEFIDAVLYGLAPPDEAYFAALNDHVVGPRGMDDTGFSRFVWVED